MKLLSDILYGSPIIRVQGITNLPIEGISIHTHSIQKNFLFIAIKGTKTDAHSLIPQAIEQGATAIICEQWPENIPDNITVVQVSDSRKAAGLCASSFLDNPSRKVKLVGITGTNGKTTIATLLHFVFQQATGSAGLISTVVNKIKEKEIPSSLTTPDPITLHTLLHQMVQEGCRYVFMEVSSIAVDQKRIEGMDFDVAVFTNLTHDHLDYHGTFENYRDAKKKFFDGLSPSATALTNLDDPNGMYMLQNTRARRLTYSLRKLADFMGYVREKDINGMQINFRKKEVSGEYEKYSYDSKRDFYTSLTGTFNAYNLTAVYGVCQILELDELKTLQILSAARPVRGRFQHHHLSNGITGIIDYAHTPDALENVLKTLQDILRNTSRIITVVGCGGNRDKAKRPVMAKVACSYSDKVILTSDNPRDEDPMEIIRQMLDGVPVARKKDVQIIPDRKEAIYAAAALAKKGDVVLIAGKGHETYQEIKGVKYPFDDLEVWKSIDKNNII